MTAVFFEQTDRQPHSQPGYPLALYSPARRVAQSARVRMEQLLILLAFVLVVLPLGLAIAAFVRSGSTRGQVENLAARIAVLESEIRRLRQAATAPAPVRETPPVRTAEPVPEPIAPPPMPVIFPPQPALLVAEAAPTPAPPAMQRDREQTGGEQGEVGEQPDRAILSGREQHRREEAAEQ